MGKRSEHAGTLHENRSPRLHDRSPRVACEESMKVEFRRTRVRGYAVTIYREGFPRVEMDPAPGYDPIMPHDLLHLVVESELGLRLGIFGQLASGGNAGTFHPVPAQGGRPRAAGRLRRRASRRGEKLLRQGRHQAAESERATYICWYEWLARSADPGRRGRAAQMAESVRGLQPLTEDVLARVCCQLDDLSAQWANLEVGESLTVPWLDRNAGKRN
jgi:hypothetical protein